MMGLTGFSGSLPLYVIHRYYIFVFIDQANKDACLLIVGFCHCHLCGCCKPASGHTVTADSWRAPATNQNPEMEPANAQHITRA